MWLAAKGKKVPKLPFSLVLPFTGNHILQFRQRMAKLFSRPTRALNFVLFFDFLFVNLTVFVSKTISLCSWDPTLFTKFTCQHSIYRVVNRRNLPPFTYTCRSLTTWVFLPTQQNTVLTFFAFQSLRLPAFGKGTGHPKSFSNFTNLRSDNPQLDVLIKES